MSTNNFSTEGILISKGELLEFGTSKKRSFIIEVEDHGYREQPEFVLWNEKAENFNVGLGSVVEVSFGLAGRDGKKKDGTTFHKTELKAWKVVVREAKNEAPLGPKNYDNEKVDATVSDTSMLGEDNAYAHKEDMDDLPF